jgi:hypothetical protein
MILLFFVVSHKLSVNAEHGFRSGKDGRKMLNRKSCVTKRKSAPILGLGEGLAGPCLKKRSCYFTLRRNSSTDNILISCHRASRIMKVNKQPTRCRKDDVFTGVSTYFGHHHAHHQEKSTKPTTSMAYSAGRAAAASWRRGQCCTPFALSTL